MKRLSAILLCFLLGACVKAESRELSGSTQLDSSGVMLKSSGPLRNFERAKILVVVDHFNPELRGVQPDSCGSPSLLLTADVEMGEGHRFVFSGHGASPCDAGPLPITETIDLRYKGPERLPKDKIRSIRLQSSRPVGLRSIEWETWEQGL